MIIQTKIFFPVDHHQANLSCVLVVNVWNNNWNLMKNRKGNRFYFLLTIIYVYSTTTNDDDDDDDEDEMTNDV